MSTSVLLVDFENVQNVQKVDLARLPAHMQVRMFIGATQAKVLIDLAEQAQVLGARFKYERVKGQGRNALDFHIAFYAGELLAKQPGVEIVILSRDTGFDPLIQHLRERKFACRRVADASELVSSSRSKAVLDANAKKARELLLKSPKKKRPHTRKALTSQVATHLVKLSGAEVRAVVEQLFAAKLISEADEALTYHF